MDADMRLRPHSTLIRQSSWSGLSESSSHESLTGPLVKSNSLNSMKTPSDGIILRIIQTQTGSMIASLPQFGIQLRLFVPQL